MRWSRLVAVAVLLALACAACAPSRRAGRRRSRLARAPRVTCDFTPTSAVRAPPRPADCYVDVVLDRAPERPYVVLGRISASWLGRGRVALGSTQAVVFPMMRREACRAGAHVIFDIETSAQDHVRPGRRGSRVARSIQGTAVAAVYVRPTGELDPPPRGPGRVIRVPTHLPAEDVPRAPPREGGGEAPDMTLDRIEDPWGVPAP